MKKSKRCWKAKIRIRLLTDEAMRRERVWSYGVLILGLKPETVRPKTVWKKTWKVKR